MYKQQNNSGLRHWHKKNVLLLVETVRSIVTSVMNAAGCSSSADDCSVLLRVLQRHG